MSNEMPTQFGFYDRLRSEFPSQVIVDVTEVCNLACIHCPHPTFKQSEFYKARYQSVDLNQKLVDEVREFGAGSVQYIRYTGEGEPLVHPRLFEMLSYAVKNSGVSISLTTNGTLLSENRISKLLATGIAVVDISIDAFLPESYAKIRVNGNLELTRSNVLMLLSEAKGSSTKVVVSYVEQAINAGETSAFEAFWRENGADFVVIRRLHSAAGAVAGVAKTLNDAVENKVRRPCLYPWERIILNPRGELIFCPQDWVHGSVVSDYRNTTIRETWQSEFYKRLREAHLSNNFCDHGFCGKCPDWQHTRWPNEGRSYANMIEEFKARE
jgi:MoaA/NifB/PqqE/SkfB family radical SAM enzyme